MQTQRTAAHVGWLDRGVLAPGYVADLNVIDLDALNCRAPRIVHDLPAGGRRLMQTADGYRVHGEVRRGHVRGRRRTPVRCRAAWCVGARPAP